MIRANDRRRAGPLLAAVLLAAISTAAIPADTLPINGRVMPLEVRCMQDQILAARLEERLAIYALQDLLDGSEDPEDARASALDHVDESIRHLDAALETLAGFGGGFPPEYIVGVRSAIDDVKSWDTSVQSRLDEIPGRRTTRASIHRLEEAIRRKDQALLRVLGVLRPEVSRFRIRNEPMRLLGPENLADLALAVRSRGMYGLQHTFDTKRVDGTGFVTVDQLYAGIGVRPHTLSESVIEPLDRGRRRPGQRFLAFRGKKASQDGQAYLQLQHSLVGPFQAEFSAGLFRRARKQHTPAARVSVEFDMQGSGPPDFFVVSSRYVPEDKSNSTPSGVQVFTGSTGGVARGDLFLPGAIAADVRVVFENGRFDVSARPLGGAEEDFTAVGSWQHGDADEAWTLGVGASRLRKGTELGIDDLILTPR